jgi:DNA-binding YbaB/EbfC family protein
MAVTMLASRDARSSKTNSEVGEMKFPGGLNIQGMMKQAQQMQEKMQREMEELRVDASAGGGVVMVQMKGNHEIISLKVDPEIVKENDV